MFVATWRVMCRRLLCIQQVAKTFLSFQRITLAQFLFANLFLIVIHRDKESPAYNNNNNTVICIWSYCSLHTVFVLISRSRKVFYALTNSFVSHWVRHVFIRCVEVFLVAADRIELNDDYHIVTRLNTMISSTADA